MTEQKTQLSAVDRADLQRVIDRLARACYANSFLHGFWPEGQERNKGEMIALMHSELSEMLEGVRKPGPDCHCPEYTSEEIEAADVLIRLLDYACGHNLRLMDAVLVKMAFNESRPPKHGKAF
jgi:hypothetical protein